MHKQFGQLRSACFVDFYSLSWTGRDFDSRKQQEIGFFILIYK